MFNILLVIFISSDQEQNTTDRTPQQMSGWFTDCWCNWCTSSLSGQHTSKLLAKTTWKVPRTWEDFDPTQILSNSEVWGYSGPQLINGSARWQEVDLNSFYEEEPQEVLSQSTTVCTCQLPWPGSQIKLQSAITCLCGSSFMLSINILKKLDQYMGHLNCIWGRSNQTLNKVSWIFHLTGWYFHYSQVKICLWSDDY